ncbi:MAG: hypothetical protein MR400_03835 [Clostridiales bacterium]|nr:hypothetical protein [Clostridiales bacterium]
MKKSLSLFVAIQMIMLIFATAYAEEDFSLRNGVRFGDTKAQVRAKETIPIQRSGDNYIETQEGTLAGCSGFAICYYFTADNKLEEVLWNRIGMPNARVSDSVYEKLQTALKSKYGEPLGFSNGDCYSVTTRAWENAMGWVKLAENHGGGIGIRDYAEWDYEYQPGKHVKIEIVQKYNISRGAESHSIAIGYKYFTDEDLAAAMQKKQEESQKIINDL